MLGEILPLHWTWWGKKRVLNILNRSVNGSPLWRVISFVETFWNVMLGGILPLHWTWWGKKRVLNILNRSVKKVKRKSDSVVFWVCCLLSGFSHAMQAWWIKRLCWFGSMSTGLCGFLQNTYLVVVDHLCCHSSTIWMRQRTWSRQGPVKPNDTVWMALLA
jgi:hypothetical protein